MTTLPSDFEAACRLYKIRTKNAGLVTFDPDRWHQEQRRFHRERTGRDIVLKPRQVGFSTLELLRGLHQAQHIESWNTRVVIHDEDLAAALFRTVSLADASVRELGMAPALGTDRAKELAYERLASSISIGIAGAREQTAAKQGRSGTINRLHATEVAFWPHAETSMAGLLGAVPDSGEVLIESTPNGATGWFFEQVTATLAGDSPYKLHFFPWYEHAAYRLPVPADFDDEPRDDHEETLLRAGCDAEQIAWWRTRVRELTAEKALQEFPSDPHTCFRVSGGSYIPQATLDWLAAQTRPPRSSEHVVTTTGRTLGKLLVWAEPVHDEDYIVGADVSEGTGGDAHACDVMARSTGATVATFQADNIEPGDFGLALAVIGRRYTSSHGPALVAPERNNHGHAALRALTTEARYPRVYEHADGKLGWPTTPVTRPVLFDDLARAYEDRVTSTPDVAGVAETASLIRDTDGQPRARNKGSRGGAKDDRVIARAIAWQVRQRTAPPAKTAGTSTPQRSVASDIGDNY
ncbi:MAG: hypothetical protein IT379_23670 [Deltaproteobacteria bacterium]|nr:hypothetical protein [Deltaproteobacteria bacterium]